MDPQRARGVGGMVRTSRAVAALCLLVGVPYVVPGLGRLRLLSPLPREQRLSFASPPRDEGKQGEAALPSLGEADQEMKQPEEVKLSREAREVLALPDLGADKPPVPLEDPSGKALDAWFVALEKVARKEPNARARMTVWGDSNVAGDLLTSVLRRKLQAELGDGGHGYTLLTRPDILYFQNDVRLLSANGWMLSQIKGPLSQDGHYGVDGSAFRAMGAGSFATIATAEDGSFGRTISKVSIAYLEHPEGDPLEVLVDGVLARTVDTKGAESKPRVETLALSDGPHTIKLNAKGPRTRVFGVSLERDSGVVVDAVGMSGGKTRFLARLDPGHFKAQMAHWEPQLVVFAYGVNEAREGRPLDAFEKETREGIVGVRKAAPGASCLLIGPNDIGFEDPTSNDPSNPYVEKVIDVERRLAGELGCAFWDQRKAMGGTGSMGKWKRAGLAQADLLHPSKTGAHLLATWLYQALMESYQGYRLRKK